MTFEDHAEYVGSVTALKGKRARVKPWPEDWSKQAQIPLEERKLSALFMDDIVHPEGGQRLGRAWHLFSVTDFKLLVPVRV